MTLMSWALGACLLIHGCLSITADTERGCKSWIPTGKGKDVCCDACHPGYRLLTRCGPDRKDLCIPCKPDYYSRGGNEARCYPCTQCIGDQFPEKPCTATTDTVCGCGQGLRCGDGACSFCVQECGKGEEPEPAPGRSCRVCPSGTFNDQIHQQCKPWTTRCPNPDEYIVAKGNAVSDSKCGKNVMVATTVTPPMAPTTVTPPMTPTTAKGHKSDGKDEPGDTEDTWPVVVCVAVPSAALMAIWIIMVVKVIQKRRSKWVPTMIIRSPEGDYSDHVTCSDSPRSLPPSDDSRTPLSPSDSPRRSLPPSDDSRTPLSPSDSPRRSLPPSDDSRTPLSPSDDPRTLIVNCTATESSYHEPEEEHGSSTESLASKDSKTQLIV